MGGTLTFFLSRKWSKQEEMESKEMERREMETLKNIELLEEKQN